MPTNFPTSVNLFVSIISALLGVTSPLGWLCKITILTAPYLFLFGINDVWRNGTLDNFKSNYQILIDKMTTRYPNADIYISGDAPHHIRRSVIQHKFNYLDLPHEIEKIFMPRMKEILLEYDPTLNIIIVDHECLPKVI